MGALEEAIDRIREGAVERERDRVLPFEQLGWLRDAGFGALRVPADAGGGGADIVALTAALVDLAAADPNVPQALRGHLAFVEDRLWAPEGPDRDRWLARFAAGELVGNAVTEIGNVTLGAVSTRLDTSHGGYAITGTKYYTTGSIFADWIDANAMRPDGVEVAALVRRDQPGVTITDDWDGFGQRLTGSGTTVFEAAHVDAADVFDFATRFPYQTALYQLVLVAVLAGIAQEAERDAVHELRTRARVFSHGAAATSRHDPQLLEAIGRLSATTAATRAITLDAARVVQRAAEARGADAATVAEHKRAAELAVSRAQLSVTELALRQTTALFDVLGASATSAARDLDRHWRNARTVASHNPVAFKARIVGDAVVNDAEPPYEWYVGVPPKGAAS
ncbi:acyl-CoA dehydrogenase family protein [Protaetiibacter intestinalis]|uniref:Monooxygenase n=1 Tax=Protaetiibacter intestinalis TaxID=2419774 RepID=A0A387B2I6_9MICO|nr:acyl-CoA dehydrogenase family protein [Protaetiibacter intestinalis]AYF97764.1 monooxygenase [Protaetiibacter intestinalis]